MCGRVGLILKLKLPGEFFCLVLLVVESNLEKHGWEGRALHLCHFSRLQGMAARSKSEFFSSCFLFLYL